MAKYSDFNNSHIDTSSSLLTGVIVSLFTALIIIAIAPYNGWILFLGILVGVIIFFAGLRTVPHKHYGVKTFGEPIAHKVYNEGSHWIIPIYGFRTESLDHLTYTEEITNIFSYNNIQLSIKVTITYGLANIHQWIYTKQEAVGLLRSGVMKAINDSIKENKYTDAELIHKKKELEDDVFKQLDYVYAKKGFGIWTNTIEWIKPLHNKIIDNYVNEVTYDTQIKRVFKVAKEFDLNAEEAFRMEAIRSGVINSSESVYRLSGSKEIIEAVSLLLRHHK